MYRRNLTLRSTMRRIRRLIITHCSIKDVDIANYLSDQATGTDSDSRIYRYLYMIQKGESVVTNRIALTLTSSISQYQQ